MKLNKSAALLGFLVGLLAFSPIAFAQTYTVTVTTDKSSYSGTQTVMVSGTVSPAPGPNQAVFVQLKNPSGATVPLGTATLTSTGSYTFSFVTGGTYMQQAGTYTVVVTFDGASGQATFQYTPTAAPAPSAVQLNVQVQASSPVYAGQTVQIMALVFWSNGTLVQSTAKVTAHYHDPTGHASQLGAGMQMATGMYMWTLALPSNAADGLYTVMVEANKSNVIGWGSAGFTLNSQIASSGSLSTLQKDLMGNFSSLSKALTSLQSSLSSQISTLSTTVGTIQTTLNNLASSASSLSTALTNIQGTLTSLSNTASSLSSQLNTISGKVDNAASQASNAASAVGTTQLYVLIVAVIAAITLVLELAILVRKLS